MIKCISYWTVRGALKEGQGLDEALKLIKDAGFEGFELTVGKPGSGEPISTEATQAECEDIRAKIDAAGLKCETLASGMSWKFNPSSDDDDVRKEAVAVHAAGLERAGWLGLDAMLFVPGCVGGPLAKANIRYDHALERAREACSQLLETAGEAKVHLAIENVWNGFFLSPVEMAQFIDSFSHDYMGAYFDIGNILYYHQYPPHWIEILGQRIRRIHIKDYKIAVGGLAGFVDLMGGDVPWAESVAALKAIGYDKTIVAEMGFDPAMLRKTSIAMDAILGGGKAGSDVDREKPWA